MLLPSNSVGKMDLAEIARKTTELMRVVNKEEVMPETVALLADSTLGDEERAAAYATAYGNARTHLTEELSKLVPGSTVFDKEAFKAAENVNSEDIPGYTEAMKGQIVENRVRDAFGDATWVIDPVSGSGNFKNQGKEGQHVDQFGTAIALVVKGEDGKPKTVFSAIYNPVRDQMLVAHDGAPVTLNGVELTRDNDKAFSDQVVIVGQSPVDGLSKDDAAEAVRSQGAKIDSILSSAEEYLLLCNGMNDARTERTVTPHCHVPGVYLAQRLGMVVAMADGTPFDPCRPGTGLVVAQSEEDWRRVFELTSGYQPAPELQLPQTAEVRTQVHAKPGHSMDMK